MGAFVALAACSAGGEEETMIEPEDVAQTAPDQSEAEETAVPANGGGDMATNISEDVSAAFSREGLAETHRERVIITLTESGKSIDMSTMDGITVISRMQNLPVIVAEIDAKGLSSLADNPAIERVEPDGEMRALPE